MLLASNPVMTIGMGVMFAGVSRLGWQFGPNQAYYGKKVLMGQTYSGEKWRYQV
jgi:hypothetical protein